MRVSSSATLLLLVAGAAATQTATTGRVVDCTNGSKVTDEVKCTFDYKTTKESPLVVPPSQQLQDMAGVDGEATLAAPRTIEVLSNQKRGIHNPVKDGINVVPPAGGIPRRRRRMKHQAGNAQPTQPQPKGMSATRKVLGGLAVAVLVAVI